MITWQVVAAGPLLRLDERLGRAALHPDPFSRFLADLGNVQVAVPVLAVALAYVALRGRRSGTPRWWLPPAAAAALMAPVPALIVPLKSAVARYGPPTAPPGPGYFPSGHTATALIVYGAATLLLLPWLPTPHARRELTTACAVLNAAVGIGLIRSGYHWPLDVVASWCLCTMLLTGLTLLVDRAMRRDPSPAEAVD
ncbi:phosphatase PAP2 family protein [Streptomyces sp. V3I7]|uniref:phosphatase PAP2 family protein n=1 Tax=Streptomyces sp. V3I7 TaxID=3042278 RepID=UPI002785A3B9|nr:phosphatase PAP2 family protein [Streptomyces sp. V3I7]MDQ0993356.1 membrane-associated phospholipid phosphatase [Streptomyces sp. V3I7]